MRIVKWIVPVLALALVASFSVRAEEAAESGKVEGTVYLPGGTTPAVEAKVMLKPAAAGNRGKKAAELAEAGDKPAGAGLTATTDAEGKYSITAPAGEYAVMANLKGQGQAKSTVTVAAGETETVNLTLEKREGGAKKEGGVKKEGGAKKEGGKKDKAAE